MSISGISQVNYGYSSGYSNSDLTEETKQKLIALGINPATVSSEVQAKALIEKVTKTQKTQTTQTVATCKCSSESELIAKAKKLAAKIGANVTDTMSLEEILEAIKSTIENGKLDAYKPEAEALGCEFSNYKQTENAMYASMNYAADLNKMMLGL